MRTSKNEVVLEAGGLYLLSGIPGAGKSTVLNRALEEGVISKEMIISSDEIRASLYGTVKSIIYGEIKENPIQGDPVEVFGIVNAMIKARLKEKLTTFVDATNVTDKYRASYAKMAEEAGVPFKVLILDTKKEDCLRGDRDRLKSVGEEVVDYFAGRMEYESQFPYEIISRETKIRLKKKTLNRIDIDIIGDIHGLYDEFLKLIGKLGYSLDSNGIPVHPKGRSILWLGDFVDRGNKSLEMFRLVKKSIESGKHYAIMGNHEVKLLRNLQNSTDPKGSQAVLETFLEFQKKMKDKELKSSISFLKSLPGYYTLQGGYACVHANISTFDPLKTLFSECVYGDKLEDSDRKYQELYEKGINKYGLIRGHIDQQSKENNVYSLEAGGCFKGEIVALPYDKIVLSDEETFETFEKSKVTVKTDFDYSKKRKNSLLTQFRELSKKGLAKGRPDPSGFMQLWKYAPSVFYKNLWAEGGNALLKARGIVIDLAGNIIQHPFDKVFNYHENGAGEDISMDEKVQYVQKLNGFLGNIGLNPFTGKLLITTTGSFDSDFVGYIKDFIDRETEIKLFKFFSKNKVTLSFEVIHPEDPHIVKYPDDMFGLHLIGVRGLNPSDKNWEEEEVDKVAKELGFKRPYHGYSKFEEVLTKLRDLKEEGFMIRRGEKGNTEISLKMKSPYYLTTKFIGRMSQGNITFMFHNSERFKEKIDEEFYTLVDKIVESTNEEYFSNLSKEDRVVFVRNLVEQLI